MRKLVQMFSVADQDHISCVIYLQASATLAPSQYDFGLALDDTDVTIGGVQQQQALVTQNKTCSTLVLTNTTIARNTAGGAGGALYVTSSQGFLPICGMCASLV